MALNGLNCAAVPLRIYTHSLTHTQRFSPVAADCSTPALQQQLMMMMMMMINAAIT